MTRTMLAAGSALLLAFGTTACATTSDAQPAFGPDAEPTTTQVENYNSLLVTVEALSGGKERRLREVETSRQATFALSPGIDELDLRLRVDPLGSADTWTSTELSVPPGKMWCSSSWSPMWTSPR